MARDLAIDLGTANTLVYQKQRGILFAEPTVIALNKETGAVLAMGEEAWRMIGRTPGYIVAVRPLRSGAISDFDITEKLIRLILQRAGVNRFSRPKVLVCVPSALTDVERRAVEEATLSAGARTCHLIEEPIAAAIGAGLPIHEPLGSLVVDVGGGTSDLALISMGGIVTNTAVRVGGFDLDAAIQSFVRREYTIAIGERTAERRGGRCRLSRIVAARPRSGRAEQRHHANGRRRDALGLRCIAFPGSRGSRSHDRSTSRVGRARRGKMPRGLREPEVHLCR